MAKAYRPLPPASELWELFSYNPLTGNLHWKTHKVPRHIGKKFGSLFTNGYVVGEIQGVKYTTHRLIWVWFYGTEPEEIDHINRCRNDNRIWNLRSGSRSANHCNRSNVKGYTRTKEGKFRALIGIHGIQYYLGHYDTESQARAAYDAAAAFLHGTYVEEKRLPVNVLDNIKRFHAKASTRRTRSSKKTNTGAGQ